VGYKLGGKTIGTIPPTVAELAALEPVYDYRPGWRSSTFGMSHYEDLPAKARDYIAYLEQQTGVEVGCISTGPERNQTIVRSGSRFASLVG
jgi:adenylosuccinate synthase